MSAGSASSLSMRLLMPRVKTEEKYFVSSFSSLIITRKTFTIWYLHEIQTPNTSNTSRLGIFIHQHSKRYVNIAAHRQ